MAARKLQQEVDKCFKKVDEGCAEFDGIYEKIEQSTSVAQKDKQEENLKREIKKLQRLRDQIKTWYANSDVKDKEPLMDKRRQIETKMELFKAVEKAMKTKAFSKEGLSAAAKLDPKERARAEACDFLSNMVDDLERQIETMEAEGESIQATMKKGKSQSTKADRIAEIERLTERHKWHQGKLELIRRSLENGGIETEQVNDLEESIRYYVSDGMNEEFMEDDEMYDDLNLVEEEDLYAINPETDKVSSQDAQSVQEDTPEPESRSASIPGNKSKTQEPPSATARRPSQQLKSPLPALATLHTPLSNLNSGVSASNMKPALVPSRPPGETLKYASIASAAAANIGIAPLPPAPGSTPPSASVLPTTSQSSAFASPAPSYAQPVQPAASQTSSFKPAQAGGIAEVQATTSQRQSPALSQSSAVPSFSQNSSVPQTPAVEKVESSRPAASQAAKFAAPKADHRAGLPAPNGVTSVSKDTDGEDADESIFHLPSGFQDLLHSFEVTQARASHFPSPAGFRMMENSWDTRPLPVDADKPTLVKPKYRFATPEYYPQSSLPIFDNPALYSKIDPDTLFYIFYYKQGTYQQFLAAKALKEQSWRFHKQYQTWFQRHEEPKTITDEFEQGTYRFFDYESTWMNRRKADFKFAYKFLEDDV